MTFILDKENHTYKTTTKPIGIYYPYVKGTISGYTRLILNVDDTAMLQEFDMKTMMYVTTATGTFGTKDNIFYTF